MKHLSCDIRISLLEDRNDQSGRDIMEVRRKTFVCDLKYFTVLKRQKTKEIESKNVIILPINCRFKFIKYLTKNFKTL